MKAISLKTEYLNNPIGIDINYPRFFWKCDGGIKQTAYQIIAKSDDKICWDSGKVSSNKTTGIPWSGSMLKSKDAINWKVRLWDENDIPGDWSLAFFEMGLLNHSDWIAKWITGTYIPKKKLRYPVDCFKKTFHCETVQKARLYITACGLYEAKINEHRVGNFIMAPGFTCYDKRLYYQTYDVTELMIQGENDITIELADGWFRGSVGAMGVRNVYGKSTRLFAQLEWTTNDGKRHIVATDGSWSWSCDGPIRFADMKDGEFVDIQKSPTFHDKAKETTYHVIPTASNNVSVIEKERFNPIITKTPSGKQLLDFGQNIAGYVELNLTAKPNQKIYMQFAEKLDTSGEIDIKQIQCNAGKPNATPKQEITLICKEGENHYKTKFAVFGFRYASVESDIQLTENSVKAIAVYSDMEETGRFDCSNQLINKFVENTLWSMKGNFLDVPTDCPTRERAPWTGDVHIFCKTGTYLMDTAAFLRKWLVDLRDRQKKDGKVPCIAPDTCNNAYFLNIDALARMDGCCGWADAAVLVPFCLYEMYVDDVFLKESYSSMKAHVEFQISRTNRTGLFGKPFSKPDKKYISNVGQAFGEWAEPKDVYKVSVMQDFIAPHPEEATAYLSYVCGLMIEIVKKLGHTADIPLYEEYHHGCKKAYVNQFTPVNTDRQSKLVRPLALGLLDGEEEQETFRRLINSVEKRNYKIGTGFLSTPLILPLLTRMGRADVAYKMMENEEEPGWLHEVVSGATTVWEDWDGESSLNHYAPGSVCQWLFEYVCGIKVAGENHFEIKPIPGGTLKHAAFSYDSIYGKVCSGWHIENDKTIFSFEIPPNTTALIDLPDGTYEVLYSGKKDFVV